MSFYPFYWVSVSIIHMESFHKSGIPSFLSGKIKKITIRIPMYFRWKVQFQVFCSKNYTQKSITYCDYMSAKKSISWSSLGVTQLHPNHFILKSNLKRMKTEDTLTEKRYHAYLNSISWYLFLVSCLKVPGFHSYSPLLLVSEFCTRYKKILTYMLYHIYYPLFNINSRKVQLLYLSFESQNFPISHF